MDIVLRNLLVHVALINQQMAGVVDVFMLRHEWCTCPAFGWHVICHCEGVHVDIVLSNLQVHVALTNQQLAGVVDIVLCS